MKQGWGLKVKDFLKGLFMAVGTSVLVIVQASVSEGSLILNWKQIGMVAAGTAITYLLKNFFTDDVKAAKETLTKEADKKRVNYLISPSDK